MLKGFRLAVIAALQFGSPLHSHPEGGARQTAFVRLPQRTDRLSNASLPNDQQEMIVAEVARTSFDTVDDWRGELLASRARLGPLNVLVIRGSDRLCGGTGNCQTWLFRRIGNRWLNVVDGEPPVVDSLRWRGNRSTLDLIGCSNVSAAQSKCATWRFAAGKFRRGWAGTDLPTQSTRLAAARFSGAASAIEPTMPREGQRIGSGPHAKSAAAARFELSVARPWGPVRRSIDPSLELELRADVDRDGRVWGWELLVTDVHRINLGNLLDPSQSGHGIRPYDFVARAEAEQYFGSGERSLPVRGRDWIVHARCVDCTVEGSGPGAWFESGTLRVWWERKRLRR